MRSVGQTPRFWLASVWAIGLICIASTRANADGAATGVPAHYAAVVEVAPGRSDLLTTQQFDRRRIQVRAERRVAGSKGGPSVGAESLRQLLEEVDIAAEARRFDIRVAHRWVARAFRRIKFEDFPSIGEFRKYLRRVRLTEAEARQRVETQLLFQRIVKHVTAGVPDGHGALVLHRYVDSYLRRWRSKTICRAGLATDRCSNGPPLTLGGQTGFGVEPAERRPEESE